MLVLAGGDTNLTLDVGFIFKDGSAFAKVHAAAKWMQTHSRRMPWRVT